MWSWFVDPEQSPTPPSLYGAFEAASAFDRTRTSPVRGTLLSSMKIGGLPRAKIPEDPYDRAWPFVNLQWALGGPRKARMALSQHSLERVRLWC